MKSSIDIKDITKKEINKFLYRNTTIIKSGWFSRFNALKGLYKYALARQYVKTIPLPYILPKYHQCFSPYIYSKSELKHIFSTALRYPKNKICTSPRTVQAVLVLIYALGLRRSEALAITIGDIDMRNSFVLINNSKFYKSRIVPFNKKIKLFLEKYLQWRIRHNQYYSSRSPLFLGKNGEILKADTLHGIFQQIRKKAGIYRNNSDFQPRIHDLRHSFAVHRLLIWYKKNKNINELLPILSTYMGHISIASTTRYLTITDELLKKAGEKFEKYFAGEKI